MSKSWSTIGNLRKNAKGNHYLVIDKSITIFKDGQQVDLGSYRTAQCFDATESVENLAARANSTMTDENKQKALEYIVDKNIIYDVVIPPSETAE